MDKIESITQAMRNLAENEDFKKVIEASKNMFQVDEPSAPVANYEPHQTMYLDGNKAVFRHFEKLANGDYLEEAKQSGDSDTFEKFQNENQLP